MPDAVCRWTRSHSGEWRTARGALQPSRRSFPPSPLPASSLPASPSAATKLQRLGSVLSHIPHLFSVSTWVSLPQWVPFLGASPSVDKVCEGPSRPPTLLCHLPSSGAHLSSACFSREGLEVSPLHNSMNSNHWMPSPSSPRKREMAQRGEGLPLQVPQHGQAPQWQGHPMTPAPTPHSPCSSRACGATGGDLACDQGQASPLRLLSTSSQF